MRDDVNLFTSSDDQRSLNANDRTALLSVRGTDLPVVSAVTARGEKQNAPIPSPVEAIPSPTGFQTGALILGALLLVRLVKKLRHA